jgi:hypothetical protein
MHVYQKKKEKKKKETNKLNNCTDYSILNLNPRVIPPVYLGLFKMP